MKPLRSEVTTNIPVMKIIILDTIINIRYQADIKIIVVLKVPF